MNLDEFYQICYPSVEHICEVTAFKTKKRAKAALDTLAWLESGDKKLDNLERSYKFDIQIILAPHSDCGTTCCIAGAMMVCETKDEYQFGFNIREFFGVKTKQTDIFDGRPIYKLDNELSKMFFPDNNKKAKTAARTLLNYLWTGKVNWKKPK